MIPAPADPRRGALDKVRVRLDAAVDGGQATVAAWCRELADAVEPLGGTELAALARAAAAAGGTGPALVALGRRLCADGSPVTAAALLAGAHRHAPDDPAIALTWVYALGAAGRHGEACRVLRELHPWQIADLDRGAALAWHAAFDGDLTEAERWLPRLTASPAPPHQACAGELAGMVARATVVRTVTPLDRDDLRGWHFVVTGGLLLHRSPHGRESMHGRYGFVQDGYGDLLAGIRRAAAVLDVWQRPVERVIAPAERASAVLALAAARVLDRRVEAFTDRSATGMVVIYDPHRLPAAVCEALTVHRPGQVVWTHAMSWTHEPPFAPDLVTRLHQHGRAPWDGHQILDPATGELGQVDDDPAGIAALADRVTAASLADDALADVPELLALAAAAAAVTGDHAAGGMRDFGRRRRARLESPVPSLRFT